MSHRRHDAEPAKNRASRLTNKHKDPPPEDLAAPSAGQKLATSIEAKFPIVGIGASAGGLAAFEAFFSGMPADSNPGMAFILVQHLAPDHKSILTELVQRYTRMQVFEVEDGMTVQTNCAYIIPPGRDMAFLEGTLQLFEPAQPRGKRLPIDFFFRSLALDQQERAIGIVLSGTGSDGTLGVRAIKGEGGMVMAQTPESTEFDGMPRNAIATGLVDYQLPPHKMPSQLLLYTAHAFGRASTTTLLPAAAVEAAMKKIFVLLRAHTGHDFSQYKPSTARRRVDRRMAVHQLETIDGYVRYLQENGTELDALCQDLLIGVTSFFRDPAAFEVLEKQVLPALLNTKPAGHPIRVWCAGCSTGEEAYSIAILIAERMAALKISFPVQVFATDISTKAIAHARKGVYPASIATDMSAERLARFFVAEPDGNAYRIHRGIRDLMVFSELDLIRDPPFSKLDLLSCRNVMIYMNTSLQKKLIPLFHYALAPRGFLFLGTSEGIGLFQELFKPIKRKAKLYRRMDAPHSEHRGAHSHSVHPAGFMGPTLPSARRPTPAGTSTGSLRETTEQSLLLQVIAAGVLVNAQGDILYLHGRTGAYLEPSPGEAGINNVLKMAREGLRLELRSTFHKAVASGATTTSLGLSVRTNGHFVNTNVTVRPVTTGPNASRERPLFLVVLEEVPAALGADAQAHVDLKATSKLSMSPDVAAHIASLQTELRVKEEYLQSTHEELESSTEELKSSNEEMQSINEELQSTNEELETSKEELQSVNEELATVNAELQSKVADLSLANNDMNNLLAGTGIGTVFVDHQLRILRFTPAASNIINLIASDIGRPVAHMASNLAAYTNLINDVEAVLSTLIPKEVHVQAHDGRSYKMRIQPYRTLDNVIEGAVITFVDVTEMVRIQDELAGKNDLLRRAGEMAQVGGWELDVATLRMTFSPEALLINGIGPDEKPTLQQVLEMVHIDDRSAYRDLVETAISDGTPWDTVVRIITPKGALVWIRSQGDAVREGGKSVSLHGALQDITDHQQRTTVPK